MKKYSKCLLCEYALGRTCKKTKQIISDDIYNNIIECPNFKSISDESMDIDDNCCSENNRYNDSLKNN